MKPYYSVGPAHVWDAVRAEVEDFDRQMDAVRETFLQADDLADLREVADRISRNLAIPQVDPPPAFRREDTPPPIAQRYWLERVVHPTTTITGSAT